jgi:hypothetical protein
MSSKNFLNLLNLAAEQRRKLETLSVDSPAGLLGMILANPTQFEAYYGAGLSELTNELRTIIPEEELAVLDREPTEFPLGALVSEKEATKSRSHTKK